MKSPNLVIWTLVISAHVILSGTEASRSEVSMESKDPYSLLRIRYDFLSGEVWQ
jgi:hypothetical protein